MARIVITLRVMPENITTDLVALEKTCLNVIKKSYSTSEFKTAVEPIAFGIKAINIMFVADENSGSTESLEKEIRAIEGVESVEVIDVRRAIG